MLLISLSACNSQFTYDVIDAPIGSETLRYAVPEAISIPSNVLSIKIAADNWNTVLGRTLFCTDCNGYPVEVEFVDALEEITAHDEKDHAAITYHLEDKCVIYFKNHSTEFRYEELEVAIHELGHCIGFKHSTFEKSLMYAILGGDRHFTSELIRLVNN